MKCYKENVETDVLFPARIYIGTEQTNNCHYPLHWHENVEFDLVLEGTLIGRKNNSTEVINAGDFFFADSGELHETDTNYSSKLSAITVLISYDFLKSYCSDIGEYRFNFDAAAKEEVTDLIMKCCEIFKKKDELFELELSINLRELCLLMLKKCRVKCIKKQFGGGSERNIENVKKAIGFMEENYGNALSLSEISAEIGMTPNYFSRFFRNMTGKTFYTYLIEIRLFHAHSELLNTDVTITEISMNNGFPNVKAFIKAFSEVYKKTPAKYRKDNM